jgi:hypothetical protein
MPSSANTLGPADPPGAAYGEPQRASHRGAGRGDSRPPPTHVHLGVGGLGLQPLDEIAYAFLDSADRIVMTSLPEMVGLRNTRGMLEQMYRAATPAKDLAGCSRRRPREASAKPTSSSPAPAVVYQIPDDNALVMHCTNRGVPAVISPPRGAPWGAPFALCAENWPTTRGVICKSSRDRRTRLARGLLGRTQAKASGQDESAGLLQALHSSPPRRRAATGIRRPAKAYARSYPIRYWWRPVPIWP